MVNKLINRLVNLPKSQSFFLFGARGVGKSYWLKEVFKNSKCLWLNLLDDEVWDKYSLHPQMLKQQLEAFAKSDLPEWVIIDEVQKAPKLLNVVHQLIESELKVKFALTGSSARRLKQKGVNLLAGRAFVCDLFPFTSIELDQSFDLLFTLRWGSLPKLQSLPTDEEKADYLRAYTLTYLKTEVQEEQWVRNIEPFRKFLPIAAQMNGQPLNYSKIAEDVGVEHTTVKSYYEILIDTLIGFELPAYHKSVRKQQRQNSKFYFFDLGVKRALERNLNQMLYSETSEYGYAFEHFIICEFFRLNSYYKKDYDFSYLKTKDGLEVDLIIDRPGKKVALIEIKSKSKVTERDCQSLNKIAPAFKNCERYLLSNDPIAKKIDGVMAMQWQAGLKKIF